MRNSLIKTVMEIPKIVKVVVNMGVGDAVADPKMLDVAAKRPFTDNRTEAAYNQG